MTHESVAQSQPLRILAYANQPEKARQVMAWVRALGRGRPLEVIVQRMERGSPAEAEAARILGAELGAAGHAHTVRMSGKPGSPEEIIAAEARESEYGLIVLAPAGRHGFIKLFYGSMVAHVVQRVSTSILVVRGEAKMPPARVLVCVSGARHSLTTVSVAAQAAGILGAQLTLLTVLSQVGIGMKGGEPWDRDPGTFLEGDDPLARHMKIAAEVAGRIGPRPEARIREGLVGEEILREIREGGHDLLVVGTHWAQDCDTVYEDLTSDLVQTSPITTMVVGLRAGLL